MSNLFGSRLKQLRQKAGLLQQDMAQKLGITKSAYGFYEQGKRQPTFEMTTFLADSFGVSLDYLLGRNNEPTYDSDISTTQAQTLIAIPILGTIKAGPDGYLEEQYLGTILTEKSALNEQPHFWLSVNGDSMTGFSIHDGDYVLIRKEQPISSGKICAVAIDGQEITLKRVKFERDGIILEAGNSLYPPRFFSSNEINHQDVRIIGIAKQIRRQIQ